MKFEKKCISKECNNSQFNSKLCEEHYNKCYYKPSLISPSNKCSICLEDEDNKVNLKTCCNYNFHYLCLERYLCDYSNNLICPVCKKAYTKEDIHNNFTANQIILLNNRINKNIFTKKKKITRNLKKFKINLNRLALLEEKLNNQKDKLMDYYMSSCKIKDNIEKQIDKTKLLLFDKRNRTNEILDLKLNSMKDNLINYNII